ncbi:hypothetical protein, partial [Bacteroides sp. 51]|uniref:hypothetical protein n=1 Tax=Bacteroides sp. 51 TaxID=2302938 RepID=UPI0019403066
DLFITHLASNRHSASGSDSSPAVILGSVVSIRFISWQNWKIFSTCSDSFSISSLLGMKNN